LALPTVSVYACRFNGCVKTSPLVLSYKSSRSFVDDLVIKDRYEWVYEWDGRRHHVQEVALAFPAEMVRSVRVRVRCDVPGLYIDTVEDTRVTCNSKRKISPPLFRTPVTDKEGNTYNLVLETVTDDITKEEVGELELELTFIGPQGQILHKAFHRPVQLDTLLKEQLPPPAKKKK
jgi:hypothetical protein